MNQLINLPVNVLYHINFNHLSLTYQQRVLYIEDYLEKILDSIITPATVSICAEDLCLLKTWNLRCYNKLVGHPCIKFLMTPYTHVLSYMFPDYFIDNVRLGKQCLLKLLPKDKILNIGYSSEVDLPETELLSELNSFWKGLILGETRIEIKDYTREKFPPIFLIDDKNFNFICYLSRRIIEYRNFLHKFLLGDVSKKDVLNAIEHDYQKYAHPFPLLLRIDLEVVIFNSPRKKCKFDNLLTSYFVPLQKYLQRCKIDFQWIEDCSLDLIHKFNADQLTPSLLEDYKWKNTNLRNKILSLKINRSDIKSFLRFLSLMCSDYYCTDFPNIELWSHLSNCPISIIKNRCYRDKESKIKYESIANYSLSTRNSLIKNADLEKYFFYLDHLELLTSSILKIKRV